MRAVISFVVAAVTVVLQLTIVDRIAFPGGAGPDLVLIAVAALALAGGPLAGSLTGFWGGLALDVAPPGSHFTGQDALVFCLVGYACGLLADDGAEGAEGHSALFEIMVTAAGAVCGEALVALLGVMLSDPRVTWPAITNVLPAAVTYDVLLCPFVLYAAAAALRLGGARAARRPARPAGWSPSQVRAAAAPGANQGVIRQLAWGSGPRLRLADRDKGQAARGPGAGRPAARREPQLKLGRTIPRSPAAYRTTSGAAFASGQRAGLGAAKVKFGGSGMGRSLLGGSVFSRPSPALARASALRPSALRPSALRPSAFRSGSRWSGRSAPLGRSSPFRHRGSGLAGLTPRTSRGGLFARLGSARLTGPRRGTWLSSPRTGTRFSAPRRSSWLHPARFGFGTGRLGTGRLGTGRLGAGRLGTGRLGAGRLGLPRRSPGPKSPGRGWLRGASSRGRFLSRRHGSLGRSSLGRSSLGRSSLGSYSPGRGAFSSRGLRRFRPRGLAAGGGTARVPRLKTRRRRRTGGYR